MINKSNEFLQGECLVSSLKKGKFELPINLIINKGLKVLIKKIFNRTFVKSKGQWTNFSKKLNWTKSVVTSRRKIIGNLVIQYGRFL